MQARFSDLVAISDLQQVLDSFSAAARISVELMDLDGQTIAAIPGTNICRDFHHANLQSKQRCRVINDEIRSRLENSPSVSYSCLDGLFEYSHAIYVQDQHLATVTLGQIFHTLPDKDALRQLAEEFGFDETAYLNAVKDVPIVTEEQAESYVEFLVQVLQQMAEKGLNEMRLVERLAALQEREVKLQSAYNKLETRILERTEELQKANEALQEG